MKEPSPRPPAGRCRPPEALLATAFTLWTQLFGLVCFEAFNRLDGMIAARDAYFDHQLQVMADLAGLPDR